MKLSVIGKSFLFSLLAGSALLTCMGAAETPEERGKRVVYEALQALGGDAFLHMNGRVESGRAYSFYRAQISGLSAAKIYTRYLDPVPGKVEVLERENFGIKEDSGILFTENEAWEMNYHGARSMEDEKFASYKYSTLRNIFFILRMRLKEPGLSFYSMGSDMFENRPVEKVDVVDSENNTVSVYFDARNKLPVRQQFRKRNEQFHDFDTEVSTFGLYRNVGGGITWPCNIRRERNGEKIYEMFSDAVQVNQDLRDDIFTLPADLKVLPKGK
jgi:hypothetical protein